MPTVRPLVLAAALALVAVGCGDDGDDAATATTTAPAPSSTTTEAAAEPTTDPDEPTTSSTEAEDPSTTTTEGGQAPAGDLWDVLLTPEDLPPGFTAEDEEGSSGMGDTSGLCGGEPTGTFTAPEEEAQRELTSDDQSLILSALAGRWPGDEAAGTLATYRSEAERCPATEGAEGFSLEEVEGVGDEAITLVITFDGQEAGTIWLARVDDLLLGVSILGESPDIDGRELLEVMVSRA